MSSLVLARKYRPKNFGQMVGQPHVVQALSNALLQGRLHHAYLFTGTRGIGKTTISRILAKSLNCTGADGQGGITATPCGVCEACTAIDADRYIDYIEMDAASTRGIDDIRDVIERAAYKPSVGRFKVFMIDEAHQLTKDAFNALLKTLEEPPEYLKFVLATTDPERMLPTVLSRCLQFNLRPMAPQTVVEHLAEVLKAEAVPHDAGSLQLLGRAARGSMRDALSLTDQAIAFGNGGLDEAVVRAMLGVADGAHASQLVQALARRDGAAVLSTLDALREEGASPGATLEGLAALLQRMAVEQAVPGALSSSGEEGAQAQALAPLLAADETQLLYSIALHGRQELALAADPFGALTMVVLRFLAFPSAGAPAPAAAAARVAPAGMAASVGAVVSAVATKPLVAPSAAVVSVPLPSAKPRAPAVVPPADAALPKKAAPTEAPQVSSSPPAMVTAAAPATQSPGGGADVSHGDLWNDNVRRLQDAGALNGLARELAWQSELAEIGHDADAPLWVLCVEQDSLRQSGLRDKLAQALFNECGIQVRLELRAGTPLDTPAKREAQALAEAQARAEAAVRADPLVREMLAQFKTARIVPGSVKPLN